MFNSKLVVEYFLVFYSLANIGNGSHLYSVQIFQMLKINKLYAFEFLGQLASHQSSSLLC
jgi:hypothetical protein